MLSIEILANWMQIACLVSVEEDGCKLSNACFTIHVVLTLSNLIGHASLKFHVKSSTNRIDSFCSNNETKISSFSYTTTLRYKGYVTDGVRARVETLGPIWAQNAPTYFILGTND